MKHACVHKRHRLCLGAWCHVEDELAHFIVRCSVPRSGGASRSHGWAPGRALAIERGLLDCEGDGTARAKVTGLSLQLLASAVRSDATMTSHGLPAEGQRKSAAIVSTGISNYPSLKYYIIFAHADPSYVST